MPLLITTHCMLHAHVSIVHSTSLTPGNTQTCIHACNNRYTTQTYTQTYTHTPTHIEQHNFRRHRCYISWRQKNKYFSQTKIHNSCSSSRTGTQNDPLQKEKEQHNNTQVDTLQRSVPTGDQRVKDDVCTITTEVNHSKMAGEQNDVGWHGSCKPRGKPQETESLRRREPCSNYHAGTHTCLATFSKHPWHVLHSENPL